MPLRLQGKTYLQSPEEKHESTIWGVGRGEEGGGVFRDSGTIRMGVEGGFHDT